MKIDISEGCFGPNVSIDDKSLFKHEYDDRTDAELESLQQILLDEISKIKSKLGMRDWAQIADILTSRNLDFEYDEECSNDGYSCDQCGNYNWHHSYYTKIDKTDEVSDTE